MIGIDFALALSALAAPAAPQEPCPPPLSAAPVVYAPPAYAGAPTYAAPYHHEQEHSLPRATHSVYRAPTFSMGVLLGGRGLDNDAWDPVDDQFTFGVDFVARGLAGDLFGLEFGTLWSFDESGPVDFAVGELYAGARLTFVDDDDPSQRVVPYVSGGGTLIGADIQQGNLSSEDESTAGYYLRAGLDFRVSPEFGIGLDYRHVGGTDTDLEFAGIGTSGGDLDYDQVGLTFSFYF